MGVFSVRSQTKCTLHGCSIYPGCQGGIAMALSCGRNGVVECEWRRCCGAAPAAHLAAWGMWRCNARPHACHAMPLVAVPCQRRRVAAVLKSGAVMVVMISDQRVARVGASVLTFTLYENAKGRCISCCWCMVWW
jgi:hypothetical protein